MCFYRSINQARDEGDSFREHQSCGVVALTWLMLSCDTLIHCLFISFILSCPISTIISQLTSDSWSTLYVEFILVRKEPTLWRTIMPTYVRVIRPTLQLYQINCMALFVCCSLEKVRSCPLFSASNGNVRWLASNIWTAQTYLCLKKKKKMLLVMLCNKGNTHTFTTASSVIQLLSQPRWGLAVWSCVSVFVGV